MKLFHVVTVPESLFFFRGQVRFMEERGIEVHVIASSGQLLDIFSKNEGVAVHPVEMLRAISPLRDIIAIWRICILFKHYQPDIIHAHTPKGGLLGMLAAFFSQTPVRIYTVHGLPYVTATGIKRTLLRLTEKISCSLAHKVFCVSHSLAKQLQDEKICSSKKIRVIHNGSINGADAIGHFNPERFNKKNVRASLGIPDDTLVIGFVGRLVKDKGISELFNAWNRLRAEKKNLHLLLVGHFEKKDAVDEHIQLQLTADSRVHMTGYVNDPAQYYAAMDVLAFPTYREGFGLVGIEAGAMELPVVATRIPGCVDSIVDQKTGILISPGDADELFDAINLYLCNQELRRTHGKAGRKRVLLQFQPKEICEDLHRKYIELFKFYGL
ncbi:MAG: glycosyltransferase family 1 protein [Candidatus Electrothrix sp. GM3_4]|nr:glycosyltransferase family 1 protein [Candidatus Electrothrix sp. GM3_4]